ncbi:CatB-related O-acetyltransferase [Alteromonas gilva]|uniref:CatB-related O-acetyltransferase n=1 Tax=Alteromonas gilva TaxID=2987522 RepID=UPI0035AC0B22
MATMLEDKIRLFTAQKGLKVRVVRRDLLNDLEVRYNRSLINTYFETGVSFQSAIINAGYKVFLGAYSYMNDLGYIRSNTFIGRYCSIGRRVTISAGMHAMHGVSTHPALRKSLNYSTSEQSMLKLNVANPTTQQTIILNDVWIGDGAIIMPGVTIGNGAVIGANAVVTRNVPPYTIVAGSPAKVIKKRFPEKVIANLLNSQWWNLPHELLNQMPTGNIFAFLEHLESRAANNIILPTFCIEQGKE